MINRSPYLTGRQEANAGIVVKNDGVALPAHPTLSAPNLNQRRKYSVQEISPPLFQFNRNAFISSVVAQNPNNNGLVLENELSEDELRRRLLNVDIGRRNNNQRNGNAQNDDQQDRGGLMENDDNEELHFDEQMPLGQQFRGGLREFEMFENLEHGRRGQANIRVANNREFGEQRPLLKSPAATATTKRHPSPIHSYQPQQNAPNPSQNLDVT